MDPNTAASSILIVDEDVAMRETISRWFRDAGCHCAEAGDARGALDHLRRHDVDLVTLSATLPEGSGLDLLAEVKEQWPDIEVIALTPTDSSATGIEAMSRGAYVYVSRPVDRDGLVLQTQKALERRKLILQTRRHTRTLEEKVREQMNAIHRAHEETILRLVNASRYRDEETGAHIKRTGLYCEVFAEALGWPAEQVANIRMAAPMHDLGKIGIPDAILRKPGKLTADEFQVMKTHTLIGAKMLEGSESGILHMAREIALCHHERWDGLGYPRGRKELAIPEPARILTLVDVYDALTHRRVYHEAMSEEEALATMTEERGRHFDSFLFGVFTALVPEMRRIARANPDEHVDQDLGPMPHPLEVTGAAGILVPAGVD